MFNGFRQQQTFTPAMSESSTEVAGPRRLAAHLIALAACCSLLSPSLAQPRSRGEPPSAEPAEPPTPSVNPEHAELDPTVQTLLTQPYLTEDERRDLRLKHGVWTSADLDTLQRRARAALTRGDYLDPALSDPSVDALTRAAGFLHRGELDEVITLTGADASPRAVRLRVEALWELGRYNDARTEASKLLASTSSWFNKSADADSIADAVRALAILTRLRDASTDKQLGGDNASSYRSLMSALARARDELDRFSWTVRLEEARLLDEKDNMPEGAPALRQAIAYNPASAETWALAGHFAVQQFNLEGAEVIAAKLDALAAGLTHGAAADVDRASVPASYQGAIVRAHARLRSSDSAGAYEALKPVLERYPKSRELLALQAAVVAAQFDAAQTEQLLAEFDKLSPGSADARLEVGRVLSSERQYAEAASYLEEAARRAPTWADPFTELGLLEIQAGRDDRAMAALEKSVALDPFNTRAGNSLKLVQELRTFKTLESPHFLVRYKPGTDAVLAEEMPALLEEMYQRVTGSGAGGINYEPPARTIIELMPDHHWFSVRITGMPKVHTIAASTGPVVAMEAPKEGPGHLVGPYDWLRVVRHEFTHTVTLARTKNRLPHWFTEAAAVYLEDAPREYSTCQILARAVDTETLFNLDQINTAFVRPKEPTDRAQAYAQGHWMYEYIVRRWGAKAPLDLMDRYAAGDREAAAMRSVLGVSREEFLTDFKVWANEQLITWGMNPPANVPNVRDLFNKERQTAEEAGSEPLAKPSREVVDRWLSAYPDHPEVLKLAVAYDLERTSGKPDASMVQLLERYAKARLVDDMPHKLLARYYFDQKDGGPAAAEAAIPHLEYLDIREQHSATYAMELAKSYAAIGDWSKAWSKAQRATRVDPYNPATRELAASVAIKRNDFPAAEHQITALTIIEPDRDIHKKRLEAVRAKMGS